MDIHKTRRNKQLRGMTQRGGVKNNKCNGKTQTGKECGKKCEGERCKVHEKVFKRDNPSKKLVPSDTQTSKDILTLFQKLQTHEGLDFLRKGFEEILVTREAFPPSQNSNKFITGGVAEDVMVDVFTKAGFQVENVAAKEVLIDIKLTIEGRTIGISLKNSGSSSQSVILENYRGNTRGTIRELPPTILIYTEIKEKRTRLVYIDDDILHQAVPNGDFISQVYDNKPANLSIKGGFLAHLIPTLPDSYIVNVPFPTTIPKVDPVSISLLALEYVRKQIKDSVEKEEPELYCYDCGAEGATNKGEDGIYYCDKCWNGER